MYPLFQLLAQAQQPQRFPWAILLFGLFAVAAVGLLIYFLSRVRKSEKEAEEDWGFSNRGILLTPATAATSEVKKKSEPPPKIPAALSEKPEPPPIAAASETAKARPAAESPGVPDTHVVATTPPKPGSVPAAEIIPLPADQDSVFEPQHQEPVTAAEPQLHHDQGSPFDDEIWFELDSPRPTRVAGQAEINLPAAGDTLIDPATIGASSHKERYEPPRIDPIVPRTQQVQETLPAPEISRTVSASQQAPASRARLESPAPLTRSTRPARAAAGSVLGLPAEASAGPFIIDKSRGRQDAAEVGTLANYDKPPDDAAGHSGTIALIAVIVLVCASLGAYLTIPSVHSKADSLVASLRGDREPPKSVAQVFPSTTDETKDPAQARGTLQNISDRPLSGLIVIVSLDPRAGGAAVTQEAQVSPDEVLPGQQGVYEFQIERNKYRSYKVVGLKGKNGATLPYDKINPQQ